MRGYPDSGSGGLLPPGEGGRSPDEGFTGPDDPSPAASRHPLPEGEGLRSKLQLQCQLNGARSPHLIERVETTVRSTGTQTVRQCLSRAAKECIGQVVGRISKVRMIKDVEEL